MVMLECMARVGEDSMVFRWLISNLQRSRLSSPCIPLMTDMKTTFTGKEDVFLEEECYPGLQSCSAGMRGLLIQDTIKIGEISGSGDWSVPGRIV